MTAHVELLLIRGLPGSGKSTMAKEYAKAGYVHCEADQFFEIDGQYRFDASKLRLDVGPTALLKLTHKVEE